MPGIHATASAVIDADPETVYTILADYRTHHPRILPERYFDGLAVEQGGYGAGTRIRFQMRVLGKTRTVQADVTEPEPGRILAETDPETGTVTTFTLAPRDGGRRTAVTIDTTWTRAGVQGLVEWLLAPRLLRQVYVEELSKLARYAAQVQSTRVAS